MKKQAIKITTAAAIAASAFVAVAPTQSEAATSSVDKAITKATNQMAKAYDTYHKAAKNEGKLPATGTIRNQVKLANDYYAAATKEIAKNGGSKTKQAAYTKTLNEKKYFLERAEAYLAAVNTNLNPAKNAFIEAVEGGKQKTVLAAQKAYNDAIKGFEAKVDKIYGPDARNLLKEKYAEPAHKLADSVNDEMKVYNAYKDIEQKDLIEKDLEAAYETIQSVKDQTAKIAKLDTKLAENITKAVEKNNTAFEKAVKATVAIEGITDGETTEEETKTITVKATKGSDIKVTLNGKAVAANENGSYTLKLEEGSNKVAVESTVYGVKTELNKEITSNQTPKVKNVSAINASQIEVEFNKPVLESDVIDASGNLKNITLTAETVDGVRATTPGTLKAELSTDGKSLTLTTAAGKEFKGTYTVEIAKNTVKTTKDGSYFTKYEGTVVAKDTTRPTFKGLTYNAAGTIAYLEFSEPVATIDTDFSLTSVKRADGTELNAATIAGFTDADFSNHATKRNVIQVNLSDIDVADANKAINLNFVGLKDEAGNLVSPNPVSVSVTKDVTVKAQAAITSVKRVSATKLEVAFDKELQTAPSVTIDGGTPTTATVTADAKVYEVTLTAGEQALSGLKDVSITSWDAYNTAGAITTPVTKIVDFSIERTAPTVTSTSLTEISGVDYLVVNFDEEVTLADLAAGTLTGTVSKPNGDLDVIPTLAFDAPTFHNASLTATKSKSVKIDLSTLKNAGAAYTLAPGTYNVEVSAGIAKDSFGNANAKKETAFTINTSTLKLPAPTSVASKTGKPGVVVVSFANKVDVASAQTASNYSIEGATIESAKVVTNTGSGATVELSIAAGTISHEGVRQVTVKNVKGFADSFTAMNNYTAIKSFDENVAPKLESSTAVKLTATNTIVVDFDEDLLDTSVGNDFDVYQNGTKVASTSALDTDTSKVVITLTTPVTSTSGLVVKAASTIDLTDAKHNGVVFSDTAVSN
ncbi:hypothetical protein ACIQXR_05390 [Peribacillus sp. NPDC097224]|uniref:hypothetical protein n=1 Tax=Peribacillus sp. NPDC097224 TaxID=3364399 RepID=UPI0037F2BE4B